MNDQDNVETKKGFLQNDKLLVCSMLAFYGICILGLIGGTFVWLGKKNDIISANATSTAFAVATQQAISTTTAVVRATEQAQFGFIERFDSNKNRWLVGQDDDYYSKSNIEIANGVYTWDIEEVKNTFISWSDFPFNNDMSNFHVYVDTKLPRGKPGTVCSGFLFRVVEADLDKGGYYFVLCNNSSISIDYYKKTDGWKNITTQYYYGTTNNWNRLEIIARDIHFQFLINGELIYEMEDDRLDHGGLALIIDVKEKTPAVIQFDNFGLQR